ncbi:MAG TPA: glycosyltransferase family 2 protein [Chthoniobacterales bacterium]|nr:glycosyltransferase family 2 protein [Chthoniobacterales bacterium]
MSDDQKNRRLISLVIPLFNEVDVFGELSERLELQSKILSERYNVEVVLVDDGSTDQTWEHIQAFSEQNAIVNGISLSRNFGHQHALFCGYQFARGDVVVSLDGDLQDPPELVEEMVAKWEQGNDIVFAVRKHRYGETRFKRWTAHWFYRLLDSVAHVNAPLDCGDFRLVDRRALDALLRMGDKQKYLRGMVGWVGFNSTTIEYDRAHRAAGKTKFNLAKMVKFGFDGVTSFSNVPLRIAFVLSLLAPLPFLLYLIYSLFAHVLFGRTLVEGWTSLILCVVVFGSLNLVSIGIVGEYTAKIFETVKRRPDYIVKERTKSAGNEKSDQ